jgi:hypothetical protein
MPAGRLATGSHPDGKPTEAGNRRGSLAHQSQLASQVAVQLSPEHLPMAHLVRPYWPAPRRTQAPRSRSGRAPGRFRLPARGSSAPAQSRRAVPALVAYGNTRSLRSRRAPLGRGALRHRPYPCAAKRLRLSATSEAVRWRAISSSFQRCLRTSGEFQRACSSSTSASVSGRIRNLAVSISRGPTSYSIVSQCDRKPRMHRLNYSIPQGSGSPPLSS